MAIDSGEFAPAVFLQQENGRYEIMLSDFSAGYEIADERGLQGGGYTWHALIEYLVRTRAPEQASKIEYDCEGDTFVAMSNDLEAIRAVGRLVKAATVEQALLREAFEHADSELLE